MNPRTPPKTPPQIKEEPTKTERFFSVSEEYGAAGDRLFSVVSPTHPPLNRSNSQPSPFNLTFQPNIHRAKQQPSVLNIKPSPKPILKQEAKKPFTPSFRPNRFNISTEPTKPAAPVVGGKKVNNTKRVYKKEDMAPTSVQMGINPLDQTHPVTVPFLDPKRLGSVNINEPELAGVGKDEEDEADMYRAKDSKNSSKYGPKVIQTSLAESLFKNEEGIYQGDNELIFFQLPTMLPMKSVIKEESVSTTPSTTTTPATPSKEQSAPVFVPEPTDVLRSSGYKNTLLHIPRGAIGKLYIMKSGKVKLKIGDVVYDVSQGMPLGFLQELTAIDLKKQKINFLGDVHKRMVAYPDIQTLINKPN